MPLIKNAKPGTKGFRQNIETEIKIGKKPPKPITTSNVNKGLDEDEDGEEYDLGEEEYELDEYDD